ncbi:glycosyltransferase [Rhodanobacter geophilus]|uniref:Glycosyltransferase n=1 Tax=Rhodanobacter geophilus TaxID=3162488 RepID=A0ABV3QPL9_9GAMM
MPNNLGRQINKVRELVAENICTDVIRVLHVAETCRGGVGSAIRDIANGGDDTVLFHSVLHPEEHPISGLNQRVTSVAYRRSGRNFQSLVRLAIALHAQIKIYRPHVVHAHSTFAGMVVRLVLARKWLKREVSVAYTAHGWSFDRSGHGLANALYRGVEFILSKLCDRVVCLSKHELALAKGARISERKIRLIYNAHPRLDDADHRLSVRPGEYRVLFVGRFDHQKGFDILVESIDLLKNEAIHFTLIGEAVRKRRGDAPIPAGVDALGWQPPEVVYEHMRSATVLVVPSRWEGFALAPLEAMCLGTPVLSSGASSLPEAVIEGVSGKRFDSGTAYELASILKATTVEEWQAIGKRAKEFCREVFSPDAMLSATYKLYKEISP